MKKTLMLASLMLTMATMLVWTSCKKKDSNNNNNGSGSAVALSIQTGAKTIQPDEQLTYTAVYVDANGNTSPANDVTWSVSNSSLGSFTNNVFKPAGSGYGTITATKGSLTAKVSVGVYLPAVFTVVPSAIIWTTGAGDIPLTSVYLGTGSVTGYTYSSSNTEIATVDANGKVSFVGTGECVITVTASGISGNNKVYVPVLVVGMPTASLPVTRITVTPAGNDMFRGDQMTLTAKAYNSSNTEKSVTFTWASDNTAVATVNSSGTVNAIGLGHAVITATSNGIVGQAEINVLPDTTIIVTPFMASLGSNATKQFTATAYAVNHSNKALTTIPMPAGLTWEVPTTGISMFDIATVNSTGLLTMKSSLTVGLSTVVIAHVSSPTIEEGAALITVSDCNCGTTTPGVDHINITSGTTLNLTIGGMPVNVSATAVDASNAPVTGATLSLCSDNTMVASVDASSMVIIPTGPGDAVITVCNGDKQATINVHVN